VNNRRVNGRTNGGLDRLLKEFVITNCLPIPSPLHGSRKTPAITGIGTSNIEERDRVFKLSGNRGPIYGCQEHLGYRMTRQAVIRSIHRIDIINPLPGRGTSTCGIKESELKAQVFLKESIPTSIVRFSGQQHIGCNALFMTAMISMQIPGNRPVLLTEIASRAATVTTHHDASRTLMFGIRSASIGHAPHVGPSNDGLRPCRGREPGSRETKRESGGRGRPFQLIRRVRGDVKAQRFQKQEG
jgi:hypothetical protein